MGKQVIIPNRIDLDSSQQNLAQGSHRGIWNANNGEAIEGSLGEVVNIKSNAVVATLTAGEKIVSGYADTVGGYVYFWVYSPVNKHKIIRVNTEDNSVENIALMCADLELASDTVITNPHIVDKKILYWCDGSWPKKLNIQKAYNYTNGIIVPAAETYTVINKETLSRAKYAPNKSPVCNYASDGNYPVNKLRGTLFQFSFKWVYDDNEKTAIAPISKTPIPQDDELTNGSYVENQSLNNAINITYETGSENVRLIEFYARELNTGNVYLIDRVYKYNEDGTAVGIPNDSESTYTFYNNKATEGVDQIEILRIFQNMPLEAGVEEYVDGNRGVFGDVLVGYDNIDIDATVTTAKVEIPDLSAVSNIVNLPNTNRDLANVSTPQILRLDNETIDNVNNNNVSSFIFYGFVVGMPRPEDCSVATVINASYTIPSVVSKSWSINVVAFDFDPSVNFVDRISARLRDAINADPVVVGGRTYHADSYYITNNVVLSNNLTVDITVAANDYFLTLYDETAPFGMIVPYGTNPFQISFNTVNAGQSPKLKNTKTNSWHQYGFIYKDDAGRRTAIQTSDQMRIFNPIPTFGLAKLNLINQHYITINHTPPSWAKKWSLVYLGSQISWWMQIHIDSIGTNATNGCIEIDVNTSVTNLIAAQPKVAGVNIGGYVFQKGDRIRFVANKIGANTFDTFSKLLDFEIVGQDVSSKKIWVQSFDYGSEFISQYSIVEIYTPTKILQNKIMYECGEDFDIINGYHEGSTQNQTASVPAIVTINDYDLTNKIESHTVNDCFLRYRYTGIADVNYVVEDAYASDYYISNSFDKGLPNIVNPDAQQRQLETGMIYTDKFYEYTRINGLSAADDNLLVLPQSFGKITALQMVGNTLKVNTSENIVSVYLGRTEKLDAVGNTQLILSDSVLGNFRSDEDNFGCIDYGSISKHDRYLYYLDRKRARVILNAANGGKDISAGVKSLVKDCCDRMLDDPDSYCVSAFDELHDRYILQMNWSERGIYHSITMAYSEKQQAWKEFYEWDTTSLVDDSVFGMDAIVAYNNKLYASTNGIIYEMYAGVGYNNIFGEQKKMKFRPCSNQDILKVKIYQAVTINTTNNKYLPATPAKNWSASDVEVAASGMYPTGMKSRINAKKFVGKEGVLYADFDRDTNTPMAGSDLMKLKNGRPLRGQAIEVELENSADFEVKLENVGISWIDSERSKQ